jgi:hypothetical protein
MPKTTIRNYDHYKKLRKSKAIKGKWSNARVKQKYDIGLLQLMAWEARYQTEKEHKKK